MLITRLMKNVSFIRYYIFICFLWYFFRYFFGVNSYARPCDRESIILQGDRIFFKDKKQIVHNIDNSFSLQWYNFCSSYAVRTVYSFNFRKRIFFFQSNTPMIPPGDNGTYIRWKYQKYWSHENICFIVSHTIPNSSHRYCCLSHFVDVRVQNSKWN